MLRCLRLFGLFHGFQVKSKVSDGIVVGDVADDLAEDFVVCGEFSVFHQSSKEVTQNPAEVIMANIGEKAP